MSFITETISSLKQPGSMIKPLTPLIAPVPQPQPQPQRGTNLRLTASRQHVNANVKDELAARQKRLEEYISESKMMMMQLTQAQTKREKDRLLALMREKSRLMDEEKEKMARVDTPTRTMAASRESEDDEMYQRPSPTEQKQAIFKMRWPTMSRDGGIMVISDEEEGEDDE